MSDVPPTGRPVPPPASDPIPTQSLPSQPAPEQQTQAQPAPTRWTRVRERAWGLRAVVAVALASVILGGVGGAALASAGSGEDQRSGGPGRGQFGRGGPGGFNRPPGGFNRAPGQGGAGAQQQQGTAPGAP